jgi:hypothetical protein
LRWRRELILEVLDLLLQVIDDRLVVGGIRRLLLLDLGLELLDLLREPLRLGRSGRGLLGHGLSHVRIVLAADHRRECHSHGDQISYFGCFHKSPFSPYECNQDACL